MEDLSFLEEALKRMQKKKQSCIERFVNDPSVIALIKKYIDANMNEEEIVNALNLIVKDDEIRKKYEIDKKILIRKEHIKHILVSSYEEKLKSKRKQKKTKNIKSQPSQPITNMNNDITSTNNTDEKFINPIKRNNIKL